MGNLPPPEVQEMIRQFEAGEARRADEKAARRVLSQTPEITGPPRRQMTSREIEKEARGMGYKIEPGNGRHGKHIVAPDGSRISLPDHPGNLATGTCLAVNEFLRGHREGRSRF